MLKRIKLQEKVKSNHFFIADFKSHRLYLDEAIIQKPSVVSEKSILHTTETDAMVAAGVEFYGNDALLAILNSFPFPPSFNIDVIISRYSIISRWMEKDLPKDSRNFRFENDFHKHFKRFKRLSPELNSLKVHTYEIGCPREVVIFSQDDYNMFPITYTTLKSWKPKKITEDFDNELDLQILCLFNLIGKKDPWQNMLQLLPKTAWPKWVTAEKLRNRFNELKKMEKFKVVSKDDSDKLMIKIDSVLYKGLIINMDYFMEQSEYYKTARKQMELKSKETEKLPKRKKK